MTLVETSALVGILLEEKDAKELLERIHVAERPVVSLSNAVEAALSVGRHINDYQLAGRLVVEFLDHARIELMPLPAELYWDIVRAYSRYGKGTGHPARLNFGDCLSYAFAKSAGIPMIYKGNDFAQTDMAGT